MAMKYEKIQQDKVLALLYAKKNRERLPDMAKLEFISILKVRGDNDASIRATECS